MAQEMLDHGANANTENVQGETPLHLVSRGQYDTHEGGVDIVQLLLGRTANVDLQDKCRMTPLHLACYFGRLEIAQVLLNHGARVNTNNKLGQSPLHIVLESNRSGGDGVGISRLLLGHGANVNSQDDYNETPLHLASNYGSSPLDGGCSSTVQIPPQKTSGARPLYTYCHYGHGASKTWFL